MAGEFKKIFREYSEGSLEDYSEEGVWRLIEPDDIWVLDKLIVARKMGYVAGPVGTPVPFPGRYIVRPCVNPIGLGLNTTFENIQYSTDHLTPGHFWCEVFKGDHYSVDFFYGEQYLTVKGYQDSDDFTKWHKWVRDDNKYFDLPDILDEIPFKYPWVNCEFIDGHLIEVHLRMNPDFNHIDNQQEYIPVWKGQPVTPPAGYSYVADPDLHGRIGAFVK